MIYLRNGGQVAMDQNNLTQSKFKSVLLLKKALKETSALQIIHPDAIWVASFEWNNPFDIDQEEKIKNQLWMEVPKDLLEFWAEISNGCFLYHDQKYGQWGYKIYSSSEIKNQQYRWKELFRDKWTTKLLAIGELFDDVHPIIVRYIDAIQPNAEYLLVEGNPLDPIEYWPRMANSLSEWMDRLITAQGAKFWDWK